MYKQSSTSDMTAKDINRAKQSAENYVIILRDQLKASNKHYTANVYPYITNTRDVELYDLTDGLIKHVEKYISTINTIADSAHVDDGDYSETNRGSYGTPVNEFEYSVLIQHDSPASRPWVASSPPTWNQPDLSKPILLRSSNSVTNAAYAVGNLNIYDLDMPMNFPSDAELNRQSMMRKPIQRRSRDNTCDSINSSVGGDSNYDDADAVEITTGRYARLNDIGSHDSSATYIDINQPDSFNPKRKRVESV
jgi:hypothetical protein